MVPMVESVSSSGPRQNDVRETNWDEATQKLMDIDGANWAWKKPHAYFQKQNFVAWCICFMKNHVAGERADERSPTG